MGCLLPSRCVRGNAISVATDCASVAPALPNTVVRAQLNYSSLLSRALLTMHANNELLSRPAGADRKLSSSPMSRTDSDTSLEFRQPRSTRARLHYLDNLRMFLTVLVIYHHTAIAYGGLGSWPFKSQCFPEINPILVVFNAVNQSFFMALFFWIAGVFTSIELSHTVHGRGAWWNFLKSRARRLLIPVLFFTLLIAPIMSTITFVWHKSLEEASYVNVARPKAWDIAKFFLTDILSTRGVRGPVWFCTVLFLFDAVTAMKAGFQSPTASRPMAHSEDSKGNARSLLLVILASWCVRIMYPVGSTITLLNAQPAFLPQYIYAYALGRLVATERPAEPSLTNLFPVQGSSRRALLVAVVCQVISLPVVFALASQMASKHGTVEDTGNHVTLLLSGGFNIPSLLYCAWNEYGFVTIGPALINYFRDQLDRPLSMNMRWRSSKRSTVASQENTDTSFNPPTLSVTKDRTSQKRGNKSWNKISMEPQVYLSLASYSFPAFLAHPLASLAAELLVESGTCQRRRLYTSTSTGQSTAWSSLNYLIAPLLMTAAVGTLNVTTSWAMGIFCSNTITILRRRAQGTRRQPFPTST
jgi:hypothetical protein